MEPEASNQPHYTSSPAVAMRKEKKEVDWNLAQSLYLQGHSHKFVCKKVKCTLPALQSQITRGGWCRKKQEVAQIAEQECKQLMGDALREQRELFTGAVRNQALKMVKTLESRVLPTNLAGLLEHANVVEKVAKIGSSSAGFDLDNQSNRPQLINIAVLGSLPPPQPKQAEVVDSTTICSVSDQPQQLESPK